MGQTKMQDEFKVKGSSIRSKFEFVAERFGASSERQLRESFSEHEDLFPLLDSNMYPFAFYDQINRRIAETFFDGDLSRLQEVGSFSAQKVLTSIYRAFVDGKDFIGFLQHAALLHERLYSHGEMNVEVASSGKAAHIHLTGAPTISSADLHVAAGFYTGAAQLLGLENMRCVFEVDPEGAHFQLDWE